MPAPYLFLVLLYLWFDVSGLFPVYLANYPMVTSLYPMLTLNLYLVLELFMVLFPLRLLVMPGGYVRRLVKSDFGTLFMATLLPRTQMVVVLVMLLQMVVLFCMVPLVVLHLPALLVHLCLFLPLYHTVPMTEHGVTFAIQCVLNLFLPFL